MGTLERVGAKVLHRRNYDHFGVGKVGVAAHGPTPVGYLRTGLQMVVNDQVAEQVGCEITRFYVVYRPLERIGSRIERLLNPIDRSLRQSSLLFNPRLGLNYRVLSQDKRTTGESEMRGSPNNPQWRRPPPSENECPTPASFQFHIWRRQLGCLTQEKRGGPTFLLFSPE